jgi:lipoyl(octanoyl) transferase
VDDLIFRDLGEQPYLHILQAMQKFIQEKNRLSETLDEIWFCEHPPVFTYGKFTDLSHILNPQNIPVIEADRGGQVTYHGPGQLMIYTLIDLKKRKIGVKAWVHQIEEWVIQLLGHFGLEATREPGKPGIYIPQKNTLPKICSIGLKVREGLCYHGAALNLEMDLSPFSQINPCGYPNQPIIDLSRLVFKNNLRSQVTEILMELIAKTTLSTRQNLRKIFN